MKSSGVVILAAAVGAAVTFGCMKATSGDGSRPVTILRGESAQVAQNGGAPSVDFRSAAKRILPSVVSIDAAGVATDFFGFEQQVSGSGSGVILNKEGYIITNAHVISAGERTQEILVHLANGKSYTGKLIGKDTTSDIAVLKIDAPNLEPIELGKSAGLEVGEWVIAVGNPLGQDHTLSVGVVSSLGRDLPTNRDGILLDAIQTDAAINPGNSGGALTNARGELIGINSAILSTRDQGSIGIGFAIPIDRAMPIVQDLMKYGRARYGWMGIEVYSRPGLLQLPGVISTYQRQYNAAPPSEGVIISGIAPDSPASKAGLDQYDVVTKLDDSPIKERFDFVKFMAGKRPGDKVNMTVWAQGKSKNVSITLDELQKN